jgi:hypothetical protein
MVNCSKNNEWVFKIRWVLYGSEINCIWVKWNSCRGEKYFLKYLGQFTKTWRHLDSIDSLSWSTKFMENFSNWNVKFSAYFRIIRQKKKWYFIRLRDAKNNKINLAEFWSLCANLGYCKSKLWRNIFQVIVFDVYAAFK